MADSYKKIGKGGSGIRTTGSVTDSHVAIFDGTSGTLIKDGGTGSGSGDVSSTGSTSVDNTIARYHGTGGKTIQFTNVVIDDSDNVDTAAAVKTDTISEHTAAAGVTIDGCLLKDGNVDGEDVSAVAATASAALPSASFTDAAVTGKLITGYSSGAGTVAATDTILEAVNKLNGNDALKLPLAGGTVTGDITMDNQKAILFREASGGGTNYAKIQAPAALAADYTLTLPVDDGTSGQFLKTDGSGVLSWDAAGGGDVSSIESSCLDNQIVRMNSTSGKSVQKSGCTINDSEVQEPSAADTGGIGSTTKNYSTGHFKTIYINEGGVDYVTLSTGYGGSFLINRDVYLTGGSLNSGSYVRTLGTTGFPFGKVILDGDTGDGGAVCFNSGVTSKIQSNAAGTQVEISGFQNTKISTSVTVNRIDGSLATAIAIANEARTDVLGHLADGTIRHQAAQTNSIGAACTTLATLKTLCGQIAVAFQAHNDDAILASGWAYHNAQMATHALASTTDPTTLEECFTMLADIKDEFNSHEPIVTGHMSQVGGVYSIDGVLANYNVTATDYIVGVTDTSANGTSNVILTTASVAVGRVFIIKDESGAMGTNHCDITTEGSELIDGAASFHMDTNYESVTVYCDGTNWFII